MISREELLRRIKDALWVEERAFPIHQRHIEQSMHWYGFSPEEEQTVRETLQAMAADTHEHAEALQAIYADLVSREASSY